jgi:ribosomal protein L3
MGNDRVTAQNLKVGFIDAERNLIGVKALFPAHAAVLL